MRALSVYFGGTHAAVAIVEDRKVEKVVTLQLAETQSLAPVLSQVSAALHGLLDEERAELAPKYLVMGFPGRNLAVRPRCLAPSRCSQVKLQQKAIRS